MFPPRWRRPLLLLGLLRVLLTPPVSSLLLRHCAPEAGGPCTAPAAPGGTAGGLQCAAARRRLPLRPLSACPFDSVDIEGDAGGAGGERDREPWALRCCEQAPDESAPAPGAERPRTPGPIGLPLVGNMLGMMRYGGVHRYDAFLAQRYGPVARSRLLGSPWYTVSAPELAREVLVTREADFSTRFVAPVAMRLWGDRGIIISNGAEHAMNRRLTSPTFVRPDVLERTSAIVMGFANRLAERYGRLPPGTVVDIYGIMKSVSLDAVSRAAFSLPLRALDDGDEEEEGKEGDQAADGAARRPDGRRIDQLTHAAFTLLGQAMRNPIPYAERFGLNPAFRNAQRIYAELRAAELDMIAARRAARAAAPGPMPAAARDLLDVYLDAADGEGGGVSLSEESLLRTIFDVFVAGGDTTATAICGTIYEVVANPRVLARVQAELAGVDLDDPAQTTPAALASRLPYLEACIKEGLRFYPPLAQLPRRAVRDTVLGGYFIPAGAVVAPSLTNLHMATGVWGQDAREYRPERWLEPAGGLEATLPKGSYMPFGMGPRLCVGMRLAQAEILAATAVLLKRVEWEAVPVPRKRGRRRRRLLSLWARLRGRESVDVKEGWGGGPKLDVQYPGAVTFEGGVPLRVKGVRG